MTSTIPIHQSAPSRLYSKPKRFSFKLRKQQKTQVNIEKEQRTHLINAIKNTEAELKQAYTYFNESTDSDLVDRCIYEINALHAQHNYLTRILRQK